MSRTELYQVSYQTLLDLASADGLNASGRGEIFNCFFGRDNVISALKILRSLEKKPDEKLLSICRQAIFTLINLQGQNINLESGEEPGKFIHELRRDKYEHLVNKTNPWYVYPDGILRNFDSIDATPLALIAMRRFAQYFNDEDYARLVLPAVRKGLDWLMNFGDRDQDNLLEYGLSPKRQHGGLPVQSWTDSSESLLRPDGTMPLYPIAPVEVQGYAWLALRLWADYFSDEKLRDFANNLKRRFNETFLFQSEGYTFPAQALDGSKNRIETVTGNPLILLWASYRSENGVESILDAKFVNDLVSRSFLPDLFDPDAGIRTMSTLSPTFNPGQNSYHNGSFWPVLNGLAHEGLEIWGFAKEASLLKEASLKALSYFQTPIELYTKGVDGNFHEYKNESGQTSCRQQAWSAAVALDFLTTAIPPENPTG
ncbi:hypothetical protein M1403_04045 [Patescibacteria group bacterium]|nr:hypothetical protein [Patescibacteria group bacterium]